MESWFLVYMAFVLGVLVGFLFRGSLSWDLRELKGGKVERKTGGVCVMAD